MSPDPRWLPWQELVLATMEPNEDGPTEPQTLPDAFAVQFPLSVPEGMERPYFLMGSAQDPVYQWRWTSDSDRAREALARGIGQFEPLPGDGSGLSSQASWEDGQWVLVLRRPLVGADEALTFQRGRAIPMAFFAWDGDNSEAGTRGAISTWYYLHLDEPGSNSIYVVPVAASLLTFILGLAFVVRAQREPKSRA